MINKSLVVLLLSSAIFGAGAQSLQQPLEDPDPGSISNSVLANYSVTKRDGNQKVWDKVTWDTNETGVATVRTNSYTELATASAYLVNGQWTDSSDQIQITPTGAQAITSQHRVSFLGNINAPAAVDLTLPEGDKHLVSNIIGLSYLDTATGKSVLIAEIKDSNGQLLPSGSEVLYPDAFTDFEADVLYQNHIDRLEQLIILRQSFPSPAAWGLSPDSSVFQVITEFRDPPQPVITERKLKSGLDQQLDFGVMQMGKGVAFAIGAETNTIPVTKQWVVIDNRYLLVEQTPFYLLEPMLKELPPAPEHAGIRSSPDSVLHQVASHRLLPDHKLAHKNTPTLKLASAAPTNKGVAMDYTILTTQSNFTFQCDTTYYISSNVNLSATTTIEGGTVIKFTNQTSVTITLNGPLLCRTGPFKMAVLTSKDDNTVGETISGSTGSPTNYNGATFLSGASSGAYRYLRFSYAGRAFLGYPDTFHGGVWHCQFVKCLTGIVNADSDTDLYNVLFANCGTAVDISYSGDTFHGQHVTADQVTTFFKAPDTTGKLTNSILTGVSTNGGISTLVNCTTNANSAGFYQTVGGGNYYLCAGSTNRNSGTTNINSTLLSDLKQKTTYPPIVFSNATLSVDTNFASQAQRDVDIPDRGYHYDPLYYAFGGATENGNVTFSNGTAVGWFRTTSGWYHAGHGIHIADAKVVTFDGHVDAPDYWVRCSVVQEGCNGLWQGGYGPGGLTGWAWPYITNSPQVVARFTRFSSVANDWSHYRDDSGWLIVNATSCEYYGGCIGFYNGGHHYTNCLFDRTIVGFSTDHAPSSFFMRNCTVRGGQVIPTRFDDGTNAPVVIRECAFDGAKVTTTGDGPGVTYYNFNACQSTNRTTPTGANDLLITNFNWQTSWLGNFYLPTNSPLVNTGGVTADLIALYHFTTQTNQAKETNSLVDIGYHYVACDSNGNPIDTNGNGIPDYLEDYTGAGLFSVFLLAPLNSSVYSEP